MTKFKTVPAYYLEIGYNLLTNYEFTYALCSIQCFIISFIGLYTRKKEKKRKTHILDCKQTERRRENFIFGESKKIQKREIDEKNILPHKPHLEGK
jgi:hypothetical protein